MRGVYGELLSCRGVKLLRDSAIYTKTTSQAVKRCGVGDASCIVQCVSGKGLCY